jgi:glycosyltransferase involved in cell wall biosynthesis
MKIAVYTIAKNEEQFVQRWADSCAEADYRLILDTGSTDDTFAYAYGAGIDVHQKVFDPWRFDHARNYALAKLPNDIDICIALDMDEVLQPGWRQALETIPAGTTRPRYKYVWSWNPDGSEGLTYGGDKIHTRHGYTWKHPVHEILKPEIPEQQHWVDGLEIHHHPDHTKSRGQYFDLLKLAVEEDPHDDRNQFYLAREYFFHGKHELAQYHFHQHLAMSLWHPERAASHRYIAKMRPEAREFHLYRAIAEDRGRRESWIDLAKHYYDIQNWTACYHTCHMALAIKDKPLDYLCEAEAWGWLPYDLLAISCWHLGLTQEAKTHGAKAVELNPADERLLNNFRWYGL